MKLSNTVMEALLIANLHDQHEQHRKEGHTNRPRSRRTARATTSHTITVTIPLPANPTPTATPPPLPGRVGPPPFPRSTWNHTLWEVVVTVDPNTNQAAVSLREGPNHTHPGGKLWGALVGGGGRVALPPVHQPTNPPPNLPVRPTQFYHLASLNSPHTRVERFAFRRLCRLLKTISHNKAPVTSWVRAFGIHL